jgi:4-amino-4-deoxy-L-arabinose transferase-like glycosyltransferase
VKSNWNLVLGLVPVAVSAMGWAIVMAAIPPASQEFPLADDFSFARGCFAFARGEGVHYGGWVSMPLIGQWTWACPFVWLMGEKHFALRLSTLVLSWLGLYAFYDLLRRQGFAAELAIVIVVGLALNPLFFLLQGTFMTDVPALSLSLVALALYQRAFEASSLITFILGSATAVLATLVRQTGVAVPVAAALVLLGQPLLRRRAPWWLAVIVPILLGLAIHSWFQGRPDVLPVETRIPTNDIALAYLYAAIHFCGLMALPILAMDCGLRSWTRWLRARFPELSQREAYAATAGSTVILGAAMVGGALYWNTHASLVMYKGGLFPYLDGIITVFGTYMGQPARTELLDERARWVLTILGCVGAAALLWKLADRLLTRGGLQILLIYSGLQLGMLLLARNVFDRYLIVLLPAALLVSGTDVSGVSRKSVIGLVMLVIIGVISIALAHDWLSWNAARWKLGLRVVSTSQVAPTDIAGGFEWSGWWAQSDKRASDRYLFAFAPMAGYRVVDREPYRQWLPPAPRFFYVLEARGDEPEGPSNP